MGLIWVRHDSPFEMMLRGLGSMAPQPSVELGDLIQSPIC
jgi:hypothetical protein